MHVFLKTFNKVLFIGAAQYYLPFLKQSLCVPHQASSRPAPQRAWWQPCWAWWTGAGHGPGRQLRLPRQTGFRQTQQWRQTVSHFCSESSKDFLGGRDLSFRCPVTSDGGAFGFMFVSTVRNPRRSVAGVVFTTGETPRTKRGGCSKNQNLFP